MTDFCKFNITPKNMRVLWEINNNCNYTCLYCIFSSGLKTPPSQVPQERLLDIARSFSAAGVRSVKITGGEPTLVGNLMQIAHCLNNQCIEFDLSTNASGLTKAMLQELAGMHNFSKLHISVDGASEKSHDAVRGVGSWVKTQKGFEQIQAIKDRGFKVRVGCVIHKSNEGELGEMVDAAVGVGANSIAFSMMEAHGRMSQRKNLYLKHKATMSVQEIADICDLLEQTYKGKIQVTHNLASIKVKEDVSQYKSPLKLDHCPAWRDFLFLDHSASLSGCSWLTGVQGKISLQNYNYNLSLALESGEFSKIYNEHTNFAMQLGRSCPAAKIDFHKQKNMASKNLIPIYEVK